MNEGTSSGFTSEPQKLTEFTYTPNTSVQNLANANDHQSASGSILIINSKGEISLVEQDQSRLIPENTILQPEQNFEQGKSNDEFVNLLKSWELYDELYVFLKEKKINIEGLKCMRERHIDQLFHEYDDFNTKMIFETKLGIWQNENGIFTVSPKPRNKTTQQLSVETWLNTMSSPSSMSNSSDLDVTVLEILKKTEQGKGILESYRKQNFLSPEDRTNVVHKIVQYFTESRKKMTVKRCEILAEEIIKIFPTECLSSYFVRGKNKIPPKGKLYDRYRGQRRCLSQLYKSKASTSKKPKLIDILNEDGNKEFTESSDTDMQNICDELKQNRNWDAVLSQWKESISYRRRFIDESNDNDIQAVLQEWPLYKYSRAPELIEIDFYFIRPQNKFDFSKWQKFQSIALQLFTERIKSHSLRAFLEQIKGSIPKFQKPMVF